MRFEKDPEKIKDALISGIITPEDYSKWMGAQGYKNALKKSRDGNRISSSTFADESNKVENVYFERDLSAGKFKFTLRGAESFQPMDLLPKQVIRKAREEQPLQRTSPTRIDASITKTVSVIDNFTKWTREMTDKIKQGTAAKK